MTNDLDTLLTALYVEIDDHLVPPRTGRGSRPRLTDAELVCLAVAQVLLGFHSEHHWLRCACCRLGHLFPYLPNQPGYHKRLKRRRCCWPPRSAIWRGPARRGAIGCG